MLDLTRPPPDRPASATRRAKNERGNAVTPTSTAAQSRVALYQPSQRPTLRTGEWMTTSYGRCRVKGKLGQRHADVIDTIMYHAEKRRMASGGLELLVDPARVRRMLSDSGYSHEQLWVLLDECMAAIIEIRTPKMRAMGHLIDSVIESKMTRPNPLNGGTGTRAMWQVRLGAAYVMLLKDDLRLYYNPAPIARLKCGISQAVARHILSHSAEPRGGWHVDTLIEAVAGTLASKGMRNARLRLKEDVAGLLELGVVLDGSRVRRCVPQPPDEASQPPKGVPQPPDSVPQPPDSVPQPPDSVPQPPDF